MSEYWKSLPRKYCEACKCWFADNKVSIEFHERGKGHQENVKRRLKEVRKRGQKQYEAQKKLEKDMKKIEQAALKAFQKDIESDPALAAEYEQEMARKAAQKKDEVPSPVAPKEPVKVKTWYEAKSPEGHTYYWCAETGVSTWKCPKSGFISLAVQEAQEQKNKKVEEETDVSVVGPQVKPDPYGGWKPVVKEEEPKIDLQLPKKSENVEEVSITLTAEKRPSKIFKEQIIGSLSDDCSGSTVTFKKRKNIANTKRNVRQRTEED